MKQIYYTVEIRRDAVETSVREACSTEVPVLQAIYGQSMVIHSEQKRAIDRPEISAQEEYNRLVTRYGEEAVLAAYGTQFGALREMDKLFKEDASTPDEVQGADAAAENDPFLRQKPAEIVEQIPDLEDERLASYYSAEKAKKNPRKKVVDAFEAEIARRKDEDGGE